MSIPEVISGIIAQKNSLGMTNQQIADTAKVSKATVDRLLRGDPAAGPSAQTLFDIALPSAAAAISPRRLTPTTAKTISAKQLLIRLVSARPRSAPYTMPSGPSSAPSSTACLPCSTAGYASPSR